MDQQRFDDLLRSASLTIDRRGATRGTLAALLALVVPVSVDAKKKKKKCKGGKKKCDKGCCLPNQGCRNGQCQCAPDEDACGAVCCPPSQACVGGQCDCPPAACNAAVDPTDDEFEGCFCEDAAEGGTHCFANLSCCAPPAKCDLTSQCDPGEVCQTLSCGNVSRCTPVCSLR